MYINIRFRSREKYTDGLIQWFFYKHRKMSELVIYCYVAKQPQPGLKPQWFILVISVQVSEGSLGPLTGDSTVDGSLERLASWHWCRPEVQTWLWAQGLSICAHSHNPLYGDWFLRMRIPREPMNRCTTLNAPVLEFSVTSTIVSSHKVKDREYWDHLSMGVSGRLTSEEGQRQGK